MKRSLTEELERIHTITYGKKIVEKKEFLKKIINGVSLHENKVDDPKKADLVTDDVSQFFKTLEDAANSGGLSQQQRGSMTFQKGVESMQIGLILLGYELPRYGVDGLFGPETAQAVAKFTSEKMGEKKPVNETKLVSQGGGIIGRPGQGTHNAKDWASRNAWDVTAPVGTDVYSLTNGVVEKIRKDKGAGVVKSGVKKIYGDQVSIKSTDGKPDVFYTHIDSSLNVGDNVKVGDVVGKIMQAGGIPPHVHIGISSGNLSDLATGLEKATGGQTSTGGSDTVMTKASPEMLKKLVELLKERGVSSDDLKQLIDISKASASLEGLSGSDFDKMMNIIIEKIEGGYYHPDMLKDGRVKDGRYGKSGETMFGIDRKAGDWENRSAAGRQFFSILDSAGARSKWPWNYMGGEYRTQLQTLATEMIKQEYIANSKRFLSKEAQAIVNSNAKLTFNFIYATYNGSGWFQRFANFINELVRSGTTDPEVLSRSLIDRRKNSENSLVAQSGRKMEKIVGSEMA